MKSCGNVKCDWSGGVNKWNCRGIPYLIKNTEDCKDFMQCDKNKVMDKESIKEAAKIKTTNPLQWMEVE